MAEVETPQNRSQFGADVTAESKARRPAGSATTDTHRRAVQNVASVRQ
jgi:hypothetical protein